MPISRPAPSQGQHVDHTPVAQRKVTYVLPPTAKKKDSTLPPFSSIDETHVFRVDLVRTLLVAAIILALELLIWWRMR